VTLILPNLLILILIMPNVLETVVVSPEDRSVIGRIKIGSAGCHPG